MQSLQNFIVSSGHNQFHDPDLVILNQLFEDIEAGFKEIKCTAYYAARRGLSQRVLNRVLKVHLNMTLRGLIERRILTEGCFLLEKTNMSMKQISYDLGITDPPYFSRFFRRNTGLSPVQYRQKAKMKNH